MVIGNYWLEHGSSVSVTLAHATEEDRGDEDGGGGETHQVVFVYVDGLMNFFGLLIDGGMCDVEQPG